MAKLPIPFRRRKKTPAEHAFDALRSALKFWAGTRAAKAGGQVVAKAAGRKRTSLVAIVGVATGAVAALVAKKRSGGGSSLPPYDPPASSPAATGPRVDPNDREPPHGDVAADLLKGDSREGAPGGRNVGAPEPPGTTGTGGEGTSAPAPPAGTGGQSTGSPSDMPGGSVTGGGGTPSTIEPGTPAGTSSGGDVPPLPGRQGEDDKPPQATAINRDEPPFVSPTDDDAPGAPPAGGPPPRQV
jgi:hypothetical protein